MFLAARNIDHVSITKAIALVCLGIVITVSTMMTIRYQDDEAVRLRPCITAWNESIERAKVHAVDPTRQKSELVGFLERTVTECYTLDDDRAKSAALSYFLLTQTK